MQDHLSKNKKGQLGGPWGFIVMGMIGLLISTLIGVNIVIPILQNASTVAGVTGTTKTILDYTPVMVALGIFMLSVLLIGVGGYNLYQERRK